MPTATAWCTISAYNNEQLRENFFNQTDLTFSLRHRLVGHEFLVGIELGEQMTDNFRKTGFFNGTDARLCGAAADPTVSVPVTFRQSATDADNHGRATIAAVYVQDQVEFSRAVAGGARAALRQVRHGLPQRPRRRRTSTRRTTCCRRAPG